MAIIIILILIVLIGALFSGNFSIGNALIMVGFLIVLGLVKHLFFPNPNDE